MEFSTKIKSVLFFLLKIIDKLFILLGSGSKFQIPGLLYNAGARTFKIKVKIKY